jgi:hypothetical protein
MKSFFLLIIFLIAAISLGCYTESLKIGGNDKYWAERSFQRMVEAIKMNDIDMVCREFTTRPLLVKGELDQDPILRLTSDLQVKKAVEKFLGRGEYVPGQNGEIVMRTKKQAFINSSPPDNSSFNDKSFVWNGVVFTFDENVKIYKIKEICIDTLTRGE